MAALIFRNFILNKSRLPQYVDFWVKMSPELKQHMKEAFMNQLASE